MGNVRSAGCIFRSSKRAPDLSVPTRRWGDREYDVKASLMLDRGAHNYGHRAAQTARKKGFRSFRVLKLLA